MKTFKRSILSRLHRQSCGMSVCKQVYHMIDLDKGLPSDN